MRGHHNPCSTVELCLICLFMAQGHSYHHAARHLGRDVHTVRTWARRLGYPSSKKAPH
jgi:transposase